MRDRTDFASWQQRIRLYCQGKENGVNILKSIDEGPFQMGTFWETLSEGNVGALHLGPERPRVYSNLLLEEEERYNVDIRATNILLQGLPKDIYTLINHYTNANDIWDNVKMLLEGEQFHEAFSRLKELLRTFHHHDILKWELVKVFYDGLDYHSQQFVMATSGGNTRTIEEGVDSLVNEDKENYDKDQRVVNRKHADIEQKNLLIANDNLIADCLSKDVFYTAIDSVLTVSRFSAMHEAFNAAQKRIAELESENSNLQNKIQNDDHDTNDNESTFEKLMSEDIMNDEGNTRTVEEGVNSLVNEVRQNYDKVML
nr:integrase, catalytic region, zinc finger, CCHC-type, peptidase aspartic, catalytic [Tanacetum cinerariifolium]